MIPNCMWFPSDELATGALGVYSKELLVKNVKAGDQKLQLYRSLQSSTPAELAVALKNLEQGGQAGDDQSRDDQARAGPVDDAYHGDADMSVGGKSKSVTVCA